MDLSNMRSFRPYIHFTPEKNWLNDPNGLVYVNGKYHLFYQYCMADTASTPLHWGHAVSADLVHWKHLPIALKPDELGHIFSGSCVYDRENTSGFGTKENPPMVAMFTHHGDQEQQSIAYSLDGINFVKYHYNPVIKNPGIKDFRDPKIFWNSVKNCWSSVLAAGDRVHFYNSKNLIVWQKTGEFGPEGNHAPGIWECPDFFPLTCNGEEKWILIVSMILPVELGGSRTQYFIGTFDGDKFICDTPADDIVFLDDGFDFYAGVTFSNTEDKILIGWEMNWQYANEVPTAGYRGMMTCPRKLGLVQTPKDGLKMLSSPMIGTDCFEEPVEVKCQMKLEKELFKLEIKGQGDLHIIFENSIGQKLKFGIDRNYIYLDRSIAGDTDFDEKRLMKTPPYMKRYVKRFFEEDYDMTVIFDVSSLEIFVDNGSRSLSSVVYPDIPYHKLTIEGNADTYLCNGR